MFIFYIVAKPNSAELASWVQALGSVVAIVFAAYLPIWHSKVSLKRRQDSLAEIMRVLSDEAVESLYLLSNVFYRPDRESTQMASYQKFHRGRDWASQIDQLAQIPVAELSPLAARDLSYLKDAVSFGAYVASLIPSWIEKNRGYSHPDVVRVLRAKRDIAALVRSRLPAPLGLKLPDMTQSQRIGILAELKRPPSEPVIVEDGEIYRRYVWASDSDLVPEYAYIYGAYTYVDGFGPWIVENDGKWATFEQAEFYIKGMCIKLHEEHMHSKYIEIELDALK